MYCPIRRTGRHNNWSRGTCWCEELVKKRFYRTGWWNKWFRKIGCGWKRSKKRSKCSYSHYQWNFWYWHYQRNFNTKIIDKPNHPSFHPTDYPAYHRQSRGRTIQFQPVSEGSTADKRHERGAPLRAHFLDYWKSNWDGKGHRHANGRVFLRNEVYSKFLKPNVRSHPYLSSTIQGPRYYQSKAPRRYHKMG